jgi:arabinofuranosyltransferase
VIEAPPARAEALGAPGPPHALSRAEKRWGLALLVLGALGLYLGWRLFWFLTDDAFITYRYASNRVLGYGYVWNAPPFLPVEGYTSFLWLVVLDLVWMLTGVEPPDSANALALLFAGGTLLLSALLTLRIPWTPRLRPHRLWFVALLLAGTLSNRTFLAWTSSGLETAMFNFCLTLWVFFVLTTGAPHRRVALASCAAALVALARPDGLLFVAGTGAMAVLLALAAPDQKSAARVLLLAALPVLAVVAHVLWRRSFYGEWLPNTYYAKVVEAWPESGAIYAASFVLEYGLWFPLAILAWTVLARRRSSGPAPPPAGSARARLAARGVPVIAVSVLLLHLCYYTFVVGGDHFEYRVYSHLVPLFYVALAWARERLALGPATAGFVMTASILLSLPVPWTHWAMTHDLRTRQETHRLHTPIAPAWPAPVRWYARAFDRSQEWLISHSACMRHQEHKVFLEMRQAEHPSREQGSKIPREGLPVYSARSVGVPAWVFPHVNVIDMLGLNDWVVARTPVKTDRMRRMAHTRKAPEGYVDSFRPNVSEDGTVTARAEPLTEDEIRSLEAKWRASVASAR